MQIFWLDYEGRRVFYEILFPDQSYAVNTFVSHPWVVTTTAGDCLRIYMPEANPGYVELTDPSISFAGKIIADELKEIEQLVKEIEVQIAELNQQIQNPQPLPVTGSIVSSINPYYRIENSFIFKSNLGYQMVHPDVRTLQVALNADPDTRLANSGPGSPGQETEYFGNLTWNSVCSFQEKYSSEVLDYWQLEECTGVVGTTTRAKLNQLMLEARKTAQSVLRGEAGDLTSSIPVTLSLWRALAGNAETPGEIVISTGLDFVVIGDIRDVAQQGYLLIFRPAEFNPAILGLSVLGILTTGGPGDPAVSGAKLAYKNIARFGLKHPEVYGALRPAFITALAKATPSEKLNVLLTFGTIVTKRGDDLTEYIDRHGEAGLRLIREAGEQIGVRNGKFPDLFNHFPKHDVDTGRAWLGRPFADEQEYLDAARRVIANSNSKKVLYYNQTLLQPRLGYLLEKNGEVFLTAVGNDGTIRTFFRLNGRWSRITESPSFLKLFKVDAF